MKVFIGADHNGFELKNQLVAYLKSKNIDVEDMGAYELDPLDDFPVFAKRVATQVQKNYKDDRGIVLCGSGIGVAVAANRFKHIRCALGFDPTQIQHGRENDHINMLALPSDYVSLEQAQQYVDLFLETPIKPEEKYFRRSTQIDQD